MALPEILAPTGLPFLPGGHGFTEDSLYREVSLGTGHSRKRRLFTVIERVVDVSWLLTGPQTALVDNWFETALDVGSEFFSVQVQDQGSLGLLWWKAKWTSPPTFTPENNDLWTVTGRLTLFDEGELLPPSSTPLVMTSDLALTGEVDLTVTAYINITFGVALTQSETLGVVEFTLGLSQIASGGDARAQAFMYLGDLPPAFPDVPAAMAIAFME